MPEVTQLRKKAELCRRLASIPTSGGHLADRALLPLAEKLDREAIKTEHPAAADHLAYDQLSDFAARG